MERTSPQREAVTRKPRVRTQSTAGETEITSADDRGRVLGVFPRTPASHIIGLQRAIGNQTVSRLIAAASPLHVVQRAINVADVDKNKETLGIKGEVKAVEVPKKAKGTALLSSYPDANKLNLTGELLNKSMVSINFPGHEKDFDEATAGDIVDLLGGGAYNHSEDLVVLDSPYGKDALLHELGHKKQNEDGFNGGTVATIVLEYHNFLANENKPWLKEGTGKPRLSYAPNLGKGKAKQTWADLRKHAQGTLHHQFPQVVTVLDQIEELLKQEKYQPYADLVKSNLVTEYPFT